MLPFLVVMWSLAGALYPAIDVTAGEKERGTLETLLVSPASRAEIVWGKFLAVWGASSATTLWNLLGLGASFGLLRLLLPVDIVRPAAWAWCAFFSLPLSALFSAICLAVGVYARSTKEGQYYLMPLVLLTVLLVFTGLTPGVELTLFYSLVPVTGVALLQQRLMSAGSFDQVPWAYLVPVFASLTLSIGLALALGGQPLPAGRGAVPVIRNLYMVELAVADWAAAVAWYRDVLELQVVLQDDARRFALMGAVPGVSPSRKAGRSRGRCC